MLYDILGRQVVKDNMVGGAAVLGVSHEQMTEHSEFIPLLLTTTSTFFMHLQQITLLKTSQLCTIQQYIHLRYHTWRWRCTWKR